MRDEVPRLAPPHFVHTLTGNTPRSLGSARANAARISHIENEQGGDGGDGGGGGGVGEWGIAASPGSPDLLAAEFVERSINWASEQVPWKWMLQNFAVLHK